MTINVQKGGQNTIIFIISFFFHFVILISFSRSVNKHMAKVHLRIRNYVCDVCGASYGEEAELKIHMNRHSDTKDYKCDHCDYSSYDKGNYKSKSHNHDDTTVITCDISTLSPPNIICVKAKKAAQNINKIFVSKIDFGVQNICGCGYSVGNYGISNTYDDIKT